MNHAELGEVPLITISQCNKANGGTRAHRNATMRNVAPMCMNFYLRLLDSVSEHQLPWMGFEVELALEVGNLVLGHVMAEQGDWHDQRHQTLAIVLDQLHELLLFD